MSGPYTLSTICGPCERQGRGQPAGKPRGGAGWRAGRWAREPPGVGLQGGGRAEPAGWAPCCPGPATGQAQGVHRDPGVSACGSGRPRTPFLSSTASSHCSLLAAPLGYTSSGGGEAQSRPACPARTRGHRTACFLVLQTPGLGPDAEEVLPGAGGRLFPPRHRLKGHHSFSVRFHRQRMHPTRGPLVLPRL